MRILTANYVLPISSPPIAGGTVCIEGQHIVAVGERDEIAARFPDAEVEDFGEAAILPGFVNCHSHLEITPMRNGLDDVEHDFTAWLLKLNALREGLSEDAIIAGAVAGATEGAQAGVTCFGDIGRYGRAGLEALKKVGLRGVVFQETEFSPEDKTADADLKKLIAKFESLRADETDLVKVGLSPHSPYTVGPRLFQLITDFALSNDVNLTIHAAESADEDRLMRQGTGFFTEVYEKYGVEWHSPLCSSIGYLDRLGVLRAKPLLAHCICVSGTDIDLIKNSGSAIAHCPKSNAKFGHGYAPFERFLDSGIVVGLGSDSVASNNICDILEESRFAALAARNRPGSKRFISAKEMLEAATLVGARALGLDHLIGTLEAGKQADVAIVSLAHAAQHPIGDIHVALIFSSNARDVKMTMAAGKEVYRSSEPPAAKAKRFTKS
jgi:cytosine/adenosine deaminase-related metal-dependent hydrolase